MDIDIDIFSARVNFPKDFVAELCSGSGELCNAELTLWVFVDLSNEQECMNDWLD